MPLCLPRLATGLLLTMMSAPLFACGNAAFELLGQLAGRWEVLRNDETIGRLHFQREAGECVLLEKWMASDGSSAVAMHWTEPAPDDAGDEPPGRVLRQLYVDNTGWMVKAAGHLENGALVYEGPAVVNGEDVVVRAVLHGLGTDQVVHIADISKDGGDNWQRIGSMTYRRVD